MKNGLNFVLFQAAWFATVWGAAQGLLWIGPAAVLALVLVHLTLLRERLAEITYIAGVGLAGSVLDSALFAAEITAYPTSSAWAYPTVPPWIASLWVAFATLPRFSLGWLRGRPRLAFVFGAIGGPLSYYAGVRMGAVAVGPEPLLTWGVLALEYAIATPILLALARGAAGRAA